MRYFHTVKEKEKLCILLVHDVRFLFITGRYLSALMEAYYKATVFLAYKGASVVI